MHAYVYVDHFYRVLFSALEQTHCTHMWFYMWFCVYTCMHSHLHVLWNKHIDVVYRFYIVLFSTLEQSHCTLVACDSKWVTVASYSTFFNIHQSGVFTALFGCYMAGATWNCCCLGAFCVLHTTMKNHIHKAACVLSCNLPPTLLAEWSGPFMCYCSNMGVRWIPK